MRAKYLADLKSETLLKPDAPLWVQAEKKLLAMQGAPLALQPTAMIRNSWKDKKIGAVSNVSVAAAHNGKYLAFRLSWQDPNKDIKILDNDQFVDAAAIFIPTKSNTPLFTMGAPGLEANMWYWRADEDTGRHIVAEGIGTTRTIDQERVYVSNRWQNGQWDVVIARALQIDTAEPVLQIHAEQKINFAVAVWEGSQGERAGIKSFTPAYTSLAIDPIN